MNEKEIKEILIDHAKHLSIANSEMGQVKESLGIIQTDIKWLKEGFGKSSDKIDILAIKVAWVGGIIAVISVLAPIFIPLIIKHL